MIANYYKTQYSNLCDVHDVHDVHDCILLISHTWYLFCEIWITLSNTDLTIRVTVTTCWLCMYVVYYTVNLLTSTLSSIDSY